jgi:hypothetical protein
MNRALDLALSLSGGRKRDVEIPVLVESPSPIAFIDGLI